MAIIAADCFKISKTNTPTREGERIATIAEITDREKVPNPSVGMMIFVEDEQAHYIVLELGPAEIGGIEIPNLVVKRYKKVESEIAKYSVTEEKLSLDLSDKINSTKVVADKAADDIGVDSITLLQGGIDAGGSENTSSYYLRTGRYSTFKLEVNSGYTIGQLAQYDLADNFVNLYNDYTQSIESVEWNPQSVVATDKNYYWMAIVFKGNSPTTVISPREAVVKSFASGLHYYMQGGEGDYATAAQQAREIVDKTIEQLPNEEDLALVEGKMQMADRAAVVKDDKVANLGYVILRKDKSFAEQVTAANIIYEIRYNFDLNGESVTLKEGCTLKFEGGTIANGTIVANSTTLTGDIRIDKISGTIVNEDFKSSYSLMPCGYEKLKMLFSLDVNSVLVDEDYTIESCPEIIEVKPNNIIGVNNAIIDVTNNVTSEGFLTSNKENFAIEDIELNFNNQELIGAAVLVQGVKAFKTHNVKIANIKSLSENAYVYGIHIKNVIEGALLRIEDVTLNNILCVGNSTIADKIGSVYGVFISTGGDVLNASTIVKGLYVDNINNIDADSNIIKEDAAGIYVAYNSTTEQINYSQVSITNAVGKNYGKRFIKLDAIRASIDNVVASANNGVSDAVISINSLGKTAMEELLNMAHCSIKNVSFEGNTNYVVTAALPNTYIDNIYCYSAEGSMAVVQISKWVPEITLNNIICKDACIFAFNDTNSATETVKIKVSNVVCNYVYTKYPTKPYKFVYNSNIADVRIENITINSIYPIKWDYADAGHLINSAIKYTGAQGSIYIDGLTVNNDYSNYRQENFFSFSREVSAIIKNFKIKTGCPTLLKAAVAKNVILQNGIFISTDTMPRGYYTITITPIDDTANVEIKNIAVNKTIDLDKDVSIELNEGTTFNITTDGCRKIDSEGVITFNNTYSKGSVRPNNVEIGFVHFDTTLSKPIWWNGTVWVDSTGVEV